MMFHVKPLPDIQLLIRLAETIGAAVSVEQAELILAHLEHVLRANEHLNLTSITDRQAAIRLHAVDSLTVLQAVDLGGAGCAIVDLGAGAGFPGIPVGIVTGSPVLLLEPRKRRSEFLHATITDLKLTNVQVACARAEEYASGHAQEASVVVARAVAPLPALVELAQPLLIPGEGRFVSMKGRLSGEELARGDSAAAVLGLERRGTVEIQLPEGGETRTLVTYQRVGDSKVRLPRRAGLAQKRPLA